MALLGPGPAQTPGPLSGVLRPRLWKSGEAACDPLRMSLPGRPKRLVAGGVWLHHTEMEIRDAVAEDAPAACHVLRRSISELCVADHRNDPTILMRWLANKTPENVTSWIANPKTSVLVAVEVGTILAVGSVTNAGEITLNYVSPDARFRGVSRALLGALEARAIQRGNVRCTLTSTETARGFYRANGYAEDGRLAGKFGTCASYPMSKPLAVVQKC
jgi:GNAT superfamily N-acetyltransferase